LTICNVGASAMIFCSPLGANAADIDVLSGLMGELSAALLGRGVKFVQALLPPTWRLETDAFKRAGFIRLAELVYMQVGTAGAFCITPPQLEWLTVLDVGEAALAEVIADTYVESRDCPALLGIRSMAEVIAAHKASGVYRPQSWLIPQYQGDFIGCALVNDAGAAHDAVDLVYLGIRPRWRQKGFGKIMLRKAISDAAQRGLGRVLLACDSANIPAMALYEHDGFRELDRRLVYIKNAHNNKA
jgi:ribosomal protein S18 acetylase RimI-like enzyme